MGVPGDVRRLEQVCPVRDVVGSRGILDPRRMSRLATRRLGLAGPRAIVVVEFVKQRQAKAGDGRLGRMLGQGYNARVEACRGRGDVKSTIRRRIGRRLELGRAAKRLVLGRRSREPGGRLGGGVQRRVLLALLGDMQMRILVGRVTVVRNGRRLLGQGRDATWFGRVKRQVEGGVSPPASRRRCEDVEAEKSSRSVVGWWIGH